jgi:hypothetical protein
LTITDAVLTSSNVSEADYTAWSSATSYAYGDRCMVAASNAHQNFQSTVPSASVTASISGLTMTVTAVASGSLAVGQPISGTGVTAGTTLTAITSTASVFTGSISGTTLTVTSVTSGVIGIGTPISGSTVAAGTVVTGLGTGTGGTGTYLVSQTQTASSTTITGLATYTVSFQQTVASTTITAGNKGIFPLANSGVVTASVSGTTMTVAAVLAGSLAVGQVISGTGVTTGTTITALGTGTGGTGTYTVSLSQTAASTTLTAIAPGASANTSWLNLGATNRWNMFDSSVTSQTANTSTIDCVFATTGRIDSVAVLNSQASSIQIKATDSIDGLVYNKTTSLISTGGISNWWAYFFEPIVYVTDFVATDLPPYQGPTIEVILTNSGGTALCGGCVIGLSRDFGGTQYGASLGIQDYSVKQRDIYGNYTINQRAFNKRADYTVWVDNAAIDEVISLLATYRATPIVYVGSDQFTSMILYGFYKDFTMQVQYPVVSICTITLEGLT